MKILMFILGVIELFIYAFSPNTDFLFGACFAFISAFFFAIGEKRV